METRDALLAWAEKARTQTSDALEVSAREVTQVDASGLQLLASLSNMEVSWTLVDASSAFTEACQTMGLAQWLTTSASQQEVNA